MAFSYSIHMWLKRGAFRTVKAAVALAGGVARGRFLLGLGGVRVADRHRCADAVGHRGILRRRVLGNIRALAAAARALARLLVRVQHARRQRLHQ